MAKVEERTTLYEQLTGVSNEDLGRVWCNHYKHLPDAVSRCRIQKNQQQKMVFRDLLVMEVGEHCRNLDLDMMAAQIEHLGKSEPQVIVIANRRGPTKGWKDRQKLKQARECMEKRGFSRGTIDLLIGDFAAVWGVECTPT